MIKDIAITLGGIFMLIPLMFMGLAIVAEPLGKMGCTNYSEVTQRKTEYKWLDGCYVETKVGMVLKSQFKVDEK